MDTRWHDVTVDANVYVQLQDLTNILSQMSHFQFALTYGSFIDLKKSRITASSLWDQTKSYIRISGCKTDIYLRALGTLHYSKLPAFSHILDHVQNIKLETFARQLFTLLEDLRLEEIIKHLRPGTKKDFNIRTSYLKHFFLTQLKTNNTRGLALDELFCIIYLLLQADSPEKNFPHAHKRQLEALQYIKPHLYESFEAKTTEQIANISTNIVEKLLPHYEDMTNTYFTLPIFKWGKSFRENTLFDELTRTDDVANKDKEEMRQDHQEYFDETFSTWHQENKNKTRQQTFLQMDLDVGTKTNLKGGNARETESGDQAFATAQGTSEKSNRKDYSELSTLESHENKKAQKRQKAPYGIDNIDAISVLKEAKAPSKKDLSTYETYKTHIKPYQRKLAKTIEKILEHKQIEKRSNLHYGRLSKNLLPVVTDEFPRLFYKKDEQSNEFDAVFTLMVDCSASMYDKMEETNRGVALFHEVLKDLRIPHAIVGFFEEATSGLKKGYPNYFHIIHSLTDSLYADNGAKIIQLEPEEDNRDGYSIRVVAEKMLERREKHKYLLVFSDGEPSAENYEQNGIVDTELAVSEVRKRGIDVIGMFLAQGKMYKQDEELMKNIYGDKRLMIQDISELPDYLAPLLKKLLLKTI